MKSWSPLNDRMAIVWRRKSTSKTSLSGLGLQSSGTFFMPHKCEQDKSLGVWVRNHQRARHVMLQDRKDLLDELGFVWRVRESALVWKGDDHDTLHVQWKKQCEKLVENERFAIVECHKCHLLGVGLGISEQDTPKTKWDPTERNSWKKSTYSSGGKLSYLQPALLAPRM
jgi:hypothetical protein